MVKSARMIDRIEALGLTRAIIVHRPEMIVSSPRRLVLHDGELHELQEAVQVA
jgi:ABC-type bacteriocin/lantibiotic exporter with double-glycine peptidase domain